MGEARYSQRGGEGGRSGAEQWKRASYRGRGWRGIEEGARGGTLERLFRIRVVQMGRTSLSENLSAEGAAAWANQPKIPRRETPTTFALENLRRLLYDGHLYHVHSFAGISLASDLVIERTHRRQARLSRKGRSLLSRDKTQRPSRSSLKGKHVPFLSWRPGGYEVITLIASREMEIVERYGDRFSMSVGGQRCADVARGWGRASRVIFEGRHWRLR